MARSLLGHIVLSPHFAASIPSCFSIGRHVTGFALTIGCFLLLQLPSNASETTYTCINNADGTSTCVSNNPSRELICTASGAGVRTCIERQTGQQLNCVISSGGTVTCLDPNSNEKLECVGLGMGENACRSGNGKGKNAEIITEPSLFNSPQGKENTPIPSFPEVIELPSAF